MDQHNNELLSKANALRDGIAEAERTASSKRSQLASIEATCGHRWGESEPDHIQKSGYTVPADPPGFGGVDRRVSSVYVPGSVNPRWKRTCQNCGKVEHTIHTTVIKSEQPKWP
jgi:hypothetical protein